MLLAIDKWMLRLAAVMPFVAGCIKLISAFSKAGTLANPDPVLSFMNTRLARLSILGEVFDYFQSGDHPRSFKYMAAPEKQVLMNTWLSRWLKIGVKPFAARRAIAIIVCCVLMGVAPVSLHGSQSEGNDIESLKAFLIKHPAVESIVFRFRNDQRARANSPSGRLDMQQHSTFQGAWQDGDFWIRGLGEQFYEASKLDTNTSHFVGRSGQIFWQAGPEFSVKAVLPPEQADAYPSSASSNNVAMSTLGGAALLSRVLDLYLFDIKPGSFRFSGNTFAVWLNRGTQAEGELFTNDGKIAAIKFKLPQQEDYSIFHLQYAADTNAIPSFFPALIKQKVYRSDGTLLRTAQEIEILGLKLASSRLSADYFLPDRFYVAAGTDPASKLRATREIFSTNDDLYQKTDLGFRRLPSPIPQKSGSTRVIFISLLALALLFPAFLMISRKKQTKQKQTRIV